MEISTLPPELQELCHLRQKEQGNKGDFKGELVKDKDNQNFRWNSTPEGQDFWDALYKKGVEYVKREFPHLYPNSTYEIY